MSNQSITHHACGGPSFGRLTPGCLWIANSGRVACGQHGGQYLAAAIASHPSRKSHVTPLDLWEILTPAMLREAALADFPLQCLDCGVSSRLSVTPQPS